ncbi:Hypothetical_protein [Hexamita inflata]|uniref:Hypothetical_protein n=1 Tax=Hexamita inflata TaxID=28002 RepID=A0AA86NTG4_9EUKA|nr:Hypothetical protein HINF_LOCUS12185 [Hexamita inflata]
MMDTANRERTIRELVNFENIETAISFNDRTEFVSASYMHFSSDGVQIRASRYEIKECMKYLELLNALVVALEKIQLRIQTPRSFRYELMSNLTMETFNYIYLKENLNISSEELRSICRSYDE